MKNVLLDRLLMKKVDYFKQFDFPSEPRVANEILENEPKSCVTVALSFIGSIYRRTTGLTSMIQASRADQ